MKNKFTIIFISLPILLALGFWIWQSAQPGKLDGFAQCIKQSEAVFYGTFWCPYCQSQKALFGKSKKYLPYVECSTPDKRGQLAVCKEKNIEGYPAWQFKDGSWLNGRISLATLAEKTGCRLPN